MQWGDYTTFPSRGLWLMTNLANAPTIRPSRVVAGAVQGRSGCRPCGRCGGSDEAMADKVSIPVSFDGHGYVARAPELSSPVVALSLSSLRKRIKAMLPERSVVVESRPPCPQRARCAASRRTGGGRVTALKFPAIAGCRERRVWVAPSEVQAVFCRRRHQPRRPP